MFYIKITRMLNSLVPILLLCLTLAPNLTQARYNSATFNRTEGMAIHSHDIYNITVVSQIECSMKCLMDENCAAVSYECYQIKNMGSGTCSLKSKLTGSNVGQSYLFVHDAMMCYAMKTVSSNSSPSNTSPNGTMIDVLGELQDQCYVGSQSDIIVLTTFAVYIYDNNTTMTSSGPCRVVLNVTQFFPGFLSLPDLSKWEATSIFKNEYVDVFSGGSVWRWKIVSSTLEPVLQYPRSLYDHLGSYYHLPLAASMLPTTLKWATFRSRLGSNDTFLYTGTDLHIISDVSPYQWIGNKSENVLNLYNYSINPWISLSDDVMAIGALGVRGEDFLLITSHLFVFIYDLDFTFGLNHPLFNLHLLGNLIT